MVKSKFDWGKCYRCKAKITDNNFGDSIEREEVFVCEDCAIKHKETIIRDLEKFRKSNNFNSQTELKKKILWVSEKMGNWFDNADKSFQENVSDYDGYNLFELQLHIIDNELTLVEDLLKDDEGILTVQNPKMKGLRVELISVHERIISYIDKEEFYSR